MRNAVAFLLAFLLSGLALDALAISCNFVAPNGSPLIFSTASDLPLIEAGYTDTAGTGARCPEMLAVDMAKFANFNANSLMNPFALDIAEGSLIGFSILALWALTWGLRELARMIRSG